MKDFDVTVSELQTFMRCRLQWDFNSHSRQSLVKLGAPKSYFSLGSFVHRGIEAAIKGEDPNECVQWMAEDQYKELNNAYYEQVGTTWSKSESDMFWEQVDKAKLLLEEYFYKWGSDGKIKGFTYIPESIERTFRVPLYPLKGGGHINLCGTFDALSIHEETGLIWVVDHKTFSRSQKGKDMSTNFQFMSYMWAVERLFGAGTCGGAIYDGMSSKLPDKPDILKSGKLSKKKSIKTTVNTYMRSIKALNLDVADYHDFLQVLEARNKGPETNFFHRVKIPINRIGIRSHERNMSMIASDIANNCKIYPNFRWEGCWDCGYKDLCHATLFGDDVEYVKRRKYVVSRETYGTTKRLKMSTSNVKTLDDLRALGNE